MAKMEFGISDVVAGALEQIRNDGYTVQRWIPCSERLPETGTDVIVYYPYWYKSPVQIAHLKGDFWESSDGEYDFPVKAVTHWKPLPEPPEGGEQE